MQPNKNEISLALEAAIRRRGSNRATRFFQSPISILDSRIMRYLGKQRRTAVDTFWGGQFSGVVPEAVTTMIRRQGYLDAPVCRILLDRLSPGSTFLDLGAHFGFFSLLASHIVGADGKVFSIEAMPSTFEFLTQNIEQNSSHDNVSMFGFAAGSEEGNIEFTDFGIVDSSLNSAFAKRGGVNGFEEYQMKVVVPVKTMDDVIAQTGITKIDLVKIDTESSEHLVLVGMQNSIRKFSPDVCVEVSDNTPEEAQHTDRIISILSELGYAPHRYIGQKLLRYDGGRIGYDNFLFQHEGRG